MTLAGKPMMQADRSRWAAVASSPWTFALAVAALLAAVVGISLQRTFLGTGVESDFSSVFAQEALRFLRGDPLQLPYHPPGYALTLALGRVLHEGSWLATGLWITTLSLAVVLATSIAAWRRQLTQSVSMQVRVRRGAGPHQAPARRRSALALQVIEHHALLAHAALGDLGRCEVTRSLHGPSPSSSAASWPASRRPR